MYDLRVDKGINGRTRVTLRTGAQCGNSGGKWTGRNARLQAGQEVSQLFRVVNAQELLAFYGLNDSMLC